MPSTLWTAPCPPLGSSDGPTVNTASLTDASPVPPIEVPPVSSVGQRLRVRCTGTFQASATSSNITWGLYWGGIAGVLIGSVAWTWISTASVAWPWQIDWEGEFRSLTTIAGGNTGTIKGQGMLHVPASAILYAAPLPFIGLPAARTVSLNTAQTTVLSLGVTFGNITSGAPALICEHINAELIG
jgi:hypothetical protein